MATESSNTPDSMQGLKVIVVAAVILLVGSGAFLLNRSATQQKIQQQQQQQQQQANSSSSGAQSADAILYGVWERNNSVIHAVNADGTGDQVVARLPLAIKFINRLDNGRYIYIADTNKLDHGARIDLYNTADNTTQTVVTADQGWGIDDIVLSKDGKWIAYWEVQLGSGEQLANGHSRVYVASLASGSAERKLVFDESAKNGATVHYPLFFSNQWLYADGFTPNKDGWGKGLVRAAIPPTAPNQYTEVLPDAAYNSDPRLSPSGTMMVYTAYDTTKGQPITSASGTGQESLESLNPTVIMTMDLNTNISTPLTTESDRLFKDVIWKKDGTEVFARSYTSKDGTSYTDAQAISIDVNTPSVKNWDPAKIVEGIILGYGPDGLITGVGHASQATANLGKTYGPVLAAMAVSDGNNLTTIPAANSQFITTLGSTVPVGTGGGAGSVGDNTLQLATFTLKPELEQRPLQQNNVSLALDPTIKVGSWCRKIYFQLLAKGAVGTTTTTTTTNTVMEFDPSGTTVTAGEDPTLQLGQFGPQGVTETVNIPFNLADFRAVKPILLDQYKCSTSPLYLYPSETTRVQIKVPNNEILQTNVPYTRELGWIVMADPSGTKIDYDYTAKVTVPEYGLVVKASDLKATLQDYGKNVGLIGRELTDYVTLWTEELPRADYYLVTHFSNPSSIMNFVITPEPDVMIQTIMYFKPLTASEAKDLADLPEPEFPQIPPRRGFTAVDWSGIIDR